MHAHENTQTQNIKAVYRIGIGQSAPLVSTCLGSYVVNLLVPNGKSDFYKMELELKYGFWNFNFFLFRLIDTII